MKIFKNLKVSAMLSFFFLLSIFNQLIAQDYYVFHLKNGTEIIGEAILDTVSNLYIIETLNGENLVLEPSEVINDEDGLFITNYERVMLPPRRILPPEGLDACRVYSPLHIGVKGVTHYVKDLSYGGEFNIGFRWSSFCIGIGTGVWYLKEVYRYPIFLYVQKYLSDNCIRPFIIGNAGYIFDTYTSDFNINPSFKSITKASPKLASVGLGLDFAILKSWDISIDAGYRYITIPTDREAASCDGPVPTLGYLELHAAYLRIGVSF